MILLTCGIQMFTIGVIYRTKVENFLNALRILLISSRLLIFFTHIIFTHSMSIAYLFRFLWTICICVAIYGTASLAQRTWNRFQTSPMVISMDRNKFVWNTSFPSLTVCPHKRLDDNRIHQYMR